MVKVTKEYFRKLKKEGSKDGSPVLPRMDKQGKRGFKIYHSVPASYASCRLAFLGVLAKVGVNPEGYGLHSGKVGGVVALREAGLSWRSLADYVGWAPRSAMPERYAKGACKRKPPCSKALAL